MITPNRLDISQICDLPPRQADSLIANPATLSSRRRPTAVLVRSLAMARLIGPSRAPLSPPYTSNDKAAQLDERDGRGQRSVRRLSHLDEMTLATPSSVLPSPSSAASPPQCSSEMQRSTSSSSSIMHSRTPSFFSDSLSTSPFAEENHQREARMHKDQEDILRLRSETAAHYRSLNREPPSIGDAELFNCFIAKVNENYNDHPGAYLKRTFDSTLQQYSQARRIGPIGEPQTSAYAPSTAPAFGSSDATTKRSKPDSLSPPSPPPKRQRTRAPAAAAVGSEDVTRRRHVRQQARKPKPTPFTTGEAPTAKFWDVQDISPPPSSLPPDAFQLWNGMKFVAQKFLDLRNDPHVHLLAPAEVELASRLRLPCASYLDAKRRIFLHRRNGMVPEPGCDRLHFAEFKKTHAQQAVNIDVNKASALHTAFTLVGWLDLKWMVPYVEPSVLLAIDRLCAAEKVLLLHKERKGRDDELRIKMIWETGEAIEAEKKKRPHFDL